MFKKNFHLHIAYDRGTANEPGAYPAVKVSVLSEILVWLFSLFTSVWRRTPLCLTLFVGGQSMEMLAASGNGLCGARKRAHTGATGR